MRYFLIKIISTLIFYIFYGSYHKKRITNLIASLNTNTVDFAELKLPEPVNKLFKSKETVESAANKLAFEANDALRYNQLTRECCLRLETTLGTIFEGCKAYPFGSRISGLGDQVDIDIFFK